MGVVIESGDPLGTGRVGPGEDCGEEFLDDPGVRLAWSPDPALAPSAADERAAPAWSRERSRAPCGLVKRTTGDGEARYDVRIRIGAKTFRRRRDADSFAATAEADRLRGVLADPRNSRPRVGLVARSWLESNPAKGETTWAADEHALRR